MKAARMMGIAALAGAAILVSAVATWGTTTTVNFDAVTVGAGSPRCGMLAGSVRDDYLAGYGITLSDITLWTDVYICNQDYYSSPPCVGPSSLPNLLTQVGQQGPQSFRMNFASPLEEFGFTRAGAYGTGPTGITHPEWWVSAYDSSGFLLDSAHEGMWGSYSYVPPVTFTLHGPDIHYVVVASNNYQWAAFTSVLLDDIVLTGPATPVPEPVTMAGMVLGIGGLVGYIRRRMAR